MVVRTAYWISGWVAFGIGLLGVVLPILPTTVFMIVAAFCFDNSSPKTNSIPFEFLPDLVAKRTFEVRGGKILLHFETNKAQRRILASIYAQILRNSLREFPFAVRDERFEIIAKIISIGNVNNSRHQTA